MRSPIEIVVYPQDWSRGETDCPVRDAIQERLKKKFRAVVDHYRMYIKCGGVVLYEQPLPDEVAKTIQNWDLSRGGEYPLKELRFTLHLPMEVLQ